MPWISSTGRSRKRARQTPDVVIDGKVRGDHLMNRPPYTHTSAIVRQVAAIGEALGRLSAQWERGGDLRLRRANRIRSVHGSLAIEGNIPKCQAQSGRMYGPVWRYRPGDWPVCPGYAPRGSCGCSFLIVSSLP